MIIGMYVCMHACMYIQFMHAYTCLRMYGCIYLWMYDVCMDACIHGCTFICIHVCIFACIYVCMLVYTCFIKSTCHGKWKSWSVIQQKFWCSQSHTSFAGTQYPASGLSAARPTSPTSKSRSIEHVAWFFQSGIYYLLKGLITFSWKNGLIGLCTLENDNRTIYWIINSSVVRHHCCVSRKYPFLYDMWICNLYSL